MAVTQISRIQHRRGMEQDLPQLASAELGWSIDTRKLYIGNGTTEEGAPSVGITEILTQYSLTNLASLLGTYIFQGTRASYTVQTGPSSIYPSYRSFQDKLDDFVNIRDFGAVGNGIDDDTAAINRAFSQIYKAGTVETQPLARRTIYFPGGTYIVSDTINIPTYATVSGEGYNSSIIKQTQGNKPLANITDSKFQSGSSIGSLSATLPDSVKITGMQFWNANSQITQPILNIDSASNLQISGSYFRSNVSPGYYPNLVHISTSVGSTKQLSIERCIFAGAGNGISVLASGVSSIQLIGTQFHNISNVAIDYGDSDNISGLQNSFTNVRVISSVIKATNWFNIGDRYTNSGLAGSRDGLSLGNLFMAYGNAAPISTVTSVITRIVANTSGEIKYEMSNSSARRFGIFYWANDGITTVFSDNFTETTTSLGANIFANSNCLIGSMTTGAANFKYGITQFFTPTQ